MKFTDERTKEGKKIVRIKKYVSDVIYHEDCFVLKSDTYKDDPNWHDTCLAAYAFNKNDDIERVIKDNKHKRHCKIIGNIYENPELLKESDN